MLPAFEEQVHCETVCLPAQKQRWKNSPLRGVWAELPVEGRVKIVTQPLTELWVIVMLVVMVAEWLTEVVAEQVIVLLGRQTVELHTGKPVAGHKTESVNGDKVLARKERQRHSLSVLQRVYRYPLGKGLLPQR